MEGENMKEVVKFESIDGKIFDTSEQAEYWDRFVIFKKWYESGNVLHGITATSASQWLDEHRAEVMLFYSSASKDDDKTLPAQDS